MRILGGYQNTRNNEEDIALTPYIFGVWVDGEIIKIIGIGICWFYGSFYIGLGFGIPKNYKSFKRHKK